ncbi:esterase family protein [Nocardia sp. NEAU-G5]|uniref:Esterase family protein n=1 Tax=Nocardia albiluteola TaxID=2842303 RepID=A0ABS6AXX6_9NOCA|nr:alpha/beta hydrolase family protein [Nocardia albiluteola]MBU3061825.1 esterase family protein [Nocardia albiluteola]
MSRTTITALAALAASAVLAAPAAADPPPGPPPVNSAITRSGLLRIEPRGPQWDRLYVESASMRRAIPVDVLHGTGSGPRPVLYLLDGVDGEPTSDWLAKGRAAEFFADKPVDVVLTGGGVGSMYSDWDHYDHTLGLNRWETFLIKELPPIVEGYLNSDGRRAIAGVSMGAQGAMMLAQRHPGFFHAVAGISGCYSTAGDVGEAVTRITVASRGGDPENLWGPPGSPEWVAHDSFLGAATLRGTALYLSAATGVPSVPDLDAVADAPDVSAALRAVGGGAALEAGALECTERFAQRLVQLHIPATVNLEPAGTHSWPDFAAELPAAWNAIAQAFHGKAIRLDYGPR